MLAGVKAVPEGVAVGGLAAAAAGRQRQGGGWQKGMEMGLPWGEAGREEEKPGNA